MSIRVHVKNNRWAPGTFPHSPEAERVFTITRERFDDALRRFPQLAGKVDAVIDWDTDNFASSMRSADVLLTWNFPTADLARVAPNLKWIHIIGAGVEHLLPLDWLPKGVTLTNNKGVHAAKAGEFCLMAVLMLHSHIPEVVTNQRTSRFVPLYAAPIAGKTLVVIGTGSLGGAGALQVSRFGVNVIGVNRHGRPVEGCAKVVTTAKLDTVLGEADYVLVAVPETPETRNLLDRRRLGLLKPTAGLINIGRQSAVDYEALCDMLEEGRLAAAILDVFEPEPLPAESRIWHTRNLIVTPHISADDGDSYIPLTLDLFFRSLQQHLDGKPLINPVDPKLGY